LEEAVMGPIETELRCWSESSEPLSKQAGHVYLGACMSLAQTTGQQPDDYEDALSEAIEAAEALGL
jgi:hypothetical protein